MLKVGQTCLDMQNGPQDEPGLDCILHGLKTLLIVLLTSKRHIRFLILIMHRARIGKKVYIHAIQFSRVNTFCLLDIHS